MVQKKHCDDVVGRSELVGWSEVNSELICKDVALRVNLPGNFNLGSKGNAKAHKVDERFIRFVDITEVRF